MCGICTLCAPNVRDPHVRYRRIDAIMGIKQTEEGYSLTLAFDAPGRVPRRGGRPAKNRGQNGNGGMKGWRRHRECGSAHMRRLCLERQSGLPELRGRQKGRISLQDGGRATLADGKRGSRFANGEIRQVLRSRYAEGRGIPKGGGGADRETAAPLIKRALLPGRYDESENGRFPRSGDLSRAQSLTRRRRLAAVFRPAHEPGTSTR